MRETPKTGRFHHRTFNTDLHGDHFPSQSPALDAEVRTLQSQLEHARALLHEAQLGFRADLEISQQTYDGRIEVRRSEFCRIAHLVR